MELKQRKNASHGLWCSLLLPFCLFPFMIKYHAGVYIFLFNVCLSSCLSPAIQDHHGRTSYRKTIFQTVLSLPSSLFMWHFFSYNFILSYTLCLFGVWYYSYLVQKLLSKCPGSFTYGEAQVVSQGVMIFLIYCVITLLSKMHLLNNFPLIKVVPQSVICLQILLFGCILLMHTLCMIPVLRQGLYFFFCCLTFSCIMMFAWHTTLRKNIFSWMWLYCMHSRKRVILILYWLLCTFISIIFVICVNWKPNYKASTLVRKYFHLIINIVYIPGIMYDLDLLRLASGIALTTFIILEMFRILKIPIIGPVIEDAFQVFLDEKDSGVLILTNIYLLIGCSSPIWLAGYISGIKGYHICLLSGIISVGFGDTAASIGGTIFGKHHWKGSKKTYEGSICAIIIQLATSLYFLSIGHECSIYNTIVIITAVLFTSLLEAKTTQVDNLILPLFMFSFLCWIQ
ncbi:dolichol kinase [Trichonephila clavata]|uniref:dolichol kinase n=1 Tax=Trichonephila clavata TaxID=2740835 RepID=A0A8X6G5F5_TRICU|nr:dolichol kinase [Trichonephila clavata]